MKRLLLILSVAAWVGCGDPQTTATAPAPEAPLEDFAAVKARAETGDAEAQYQLATRYEAGAGAAIDDAAAASWYEKAALQGHPSAQYCLAVCYADGRGVKFDNVKSLEWLSKAADAGDSMAQFAMGARHRTGFGVAKDPSRSWGWYSLSAAQGSADARAAAQKLEKTMSREEIKTARAWTNDFRPSRKQ